jgi:hypothetical protein
MLDFDSGVLVPIFSLAIPVVAIVGGITAGIIRMVLKARVMELAQRERIAAIERGMDISKLQPLPVDLDTDDTAIFSSPRQVMLNRSRGLLVGGIVTLAVGIGLGTMLGVLNDGGDRVWAVGLIPALVGVALLVSSVFIRNAADEDSSPRSPQAGPRA